MTFVRVWPVDNVDIVDNEGDVARTPGAAHRR